MSDVFRKQHRALTAPELAVIENVKTLAGYLHTQITDSVKAGREKSLALTKLEECVMWAVKGITG
jgi:hypothetical protein